jgi:hypothetical protein
VVVVLPEAEESGPTDEEKEPSGFKCDECETVA